MEPDFANVKAFNANTVSNLIGNCSELCLITNISQNSHCYCSLDFDSLAFAFAVYGVLVPTLFGIITLLGIIGNSLVLYVILSKQNMRTVTNLLLMNLAIADLSFVCVCPPFTAYQMAFSRWPFGQATCKLMHYLTNVTAYVTVYTLVAISVLRYMTVVHNAETRHIRVCKNAVLTIIATWLVFLFLNIPIPFSYDITPTDYEHFLCDINDMGSGKRIFGTFFFFAYLLPLGIIAMFSICMLRFIDKQKTSSLQGELYRRCKKRRQQASRLLIVLVVVFAVFWLPVHAHLLVFYYVEKLPDNRVYMLFTIFSYCLAYFNSCVNPLIYHCASQDFRDSFREVARCGRRQKHTSKHTTVADAHMVQDDCGVNAQMITVNISNGTSKNAHINTEGEFEMPQLCADV